MSCWDTSALAKLYVTESDSQVFEEKAAKEAAITIAALARLEMRRVAFRKEGEGLIQTGAAETVLTQLDHDIAAGQMRLVEMDAAIEAEFGAIMATCYRRTPAVLLRTFDGIHLAARKAGESELVSTDSRMREAARILGFSLFPA